MSLLSAQRPWLPLADACGYMTGLLGEFVEETELLSLALHRRLTLSVVFPDEVLVQLCKLVEEDDVQYAEAMSLDGRGTVRIPVGGPVVIAPTGQILRPQEKVYSLSVDTPCELPLIGGEQCDVRALFWKRSGVDAEETFDIDGTFVSLGSGVGKQYFRLVGKLEDGSPYPLGNLPHNAQLALTSVEIGRFVARCQSQTTGVESADKPDSGAALREPKWPWGEHHTELLSHLSAAADRFWVRFDPTDNTTAPTNEEVVLWLVQRGVSDRIAKAIATILRANGVPTGPRTAA